MTIGDKLSAPASVRPMSLDRGVHRSFLSDVVIDYGPREILSRLFLKADTELRKKGIRLTFASFDELVGVNKANSSTWAPMVPVFDPKVSDVHEGNGFAMIGWSERGEAICTTAARIIDLGGSTLKVEAESLRLFYSDPGASRRPEERVHVTAPTAATMMGRLVYGGATWYRPDYRGRGVMGVLSKLARGIGFSRWEAAPVITFMSQGLVGAGVPARCHFPNVEWAVTLTHTPVIPSGTYEGALLWAEEDYLLDVLRTFVDAGTRDTKVDQVVQKRTANQ
jgi:hypothetical protein